jgi:hypothetical protein
MTVESRSIRRVHATYRLPEAEIGARARLDALLRPVLDAALEGALARAGVAADEEVCIRSVEAGARLRLASTDATLLAEWSGALSDALAAAIRAGEPGAVRYRSRRHALVDLAVAASTADLRRAWAWRQLGLWSSEGDPADGAQTVERVVDALCAEPQSVVAVLAAVAKRGALPRLAVLLGTDGWTRLARAALAAAGAPAALVGTRDGEGTAGGGRGHARMLVAGSSIATAAIGSGSAVGLAPAARRALAVLVALEADPGAMLEPATAADSVDALARELDAGVGGGARARARRGTDSRSVLAGAGLAVEGLDPGDDPDAPPEIRTRAWTASGGLLFLLPLVAEVEPPPGRTLRWALHRLALVLLPGLDEADPAALAFAGLEPQELPPSDRDVPPTEAELDSLAGTASKVAGTLAELLEREADEELVAAVCARRAEIVADPGWIEVHLQTDELDVDVRRAGLDLDPGWLPWLGVVVRFVYE